MKKKDIYSFLVWVILFIPFLKTDFMARYEIINNIMNIWKLGSICCAILLFLKRGKISKKIVLLIIFNGWLFLITILNNGDSQQCLNFFLSVVALAFIFENRNKRY